MLLLIIVIYLLGFVKEFYKFYFIEFLKLVSEIGIVLFFILIWGNRSLVMVILLVIVRVGI